MLTPPSGSETIREMKRYLVTTAILFLCLGRAASAEYSKGQWIASGGLGLTFSPTLLLLNPQLEYVVDPNLFFGPNLQLGLGGAVLMAASGSVRYQFGTDPRLKPCVEGGLGLALAGSGYSSSAGVLIHFGIGVDYVVNHTVSVGTMIRGNLAPPLTTFFVSWPLIIGRFLI